MSRLEGNRPWFPDERPNRRLRPQNTFPLTVPEEPNKKASTRPHRMILCSMQQQNHLLGFEVKAGHPQGHKSFVPQLVAVSVL